MGSYFSGWRNDPIDAPISQSVPPPYPSLDIQQIRELKSFDKDSVGSFIRWTGKEHLNITDMILILTEIRKREGDVNVILNIYGCHTPSILIYFDADENLCIFGKNN